MISIIICSINKAALQKVKENITNTIGVPFEIIAIENSIDSLGICTVYNKGATQAQYDIFCFMHEDIFFETIGWGHKVIAHLKPLSVGLIGLAGGCIKSWVPSSWSSLIYASEINYIQHFKNGGRQEKIYRTNTLEDDAVIKKVVCIDGFWMCTRRDVFTKYTFDDKTFTGFHGYDIDFSLQVFTGYEVAVIFDILVHHYSEGSFDKAWIENAILVSDKWEKKLPMSVKEVSNKIMLRQHWTAMDSFIDKLLALNYPLPKIGKLYFKYALLKYFYWKHFLYFSKYIFVGYFKNRSLQNGINGYKQR